MDKDADGNACLEPKTLHPLHASQRRESFRDALGASMWQSLASLSARDWSRVCLDALIHAADAEYGVLLDSAGNAGVAVGLDRIDLSAFVSALSLHDGESAAQQVAMGDRTLFTRRIPLALDSKCAGFALVASERQDFALLTEEAQRDVDDVASAISGSSPWAESSRLD